MQPEQSEEERACTELQRRADRIAGLIVASDYPAIDLAIEIRKLREFVETSLPGRRGLFRMIYESRFRRLWEQFRRQEDGELPGW